MNRFVVWFLVLLWALTASAASVTEAVPVAKNNVLKSFTCTDKSFSTWLTFVFADAPAFKTQLNKESHVFTIDFMHVKREDLDKLGITQQLIGLPATLPQNRLTAVEVGPIPHESGVRLSILFDPAQSVVFAREYADLSQVVIEIISKERLGKLARSAEFLEIAALSESQSPVGSTWSVVC